MNQFDGNILALDLATVSGWCYGRPGEVPTFGSIRFGKSGGSRAAVYRALRLWLDLRLSAYPADLVVFESAANPMLLMGHTRIETIKLLIGMTEHVEEWCLNRVELREASVSDVRAFFLGSNRVKRDLAKARTIELCNLLGWAVENNDEADAAALWAYQVAHLRPDLAIQFSPLFNKRRIISSF